MRKKLQVFVSSTYTDLKAERQACVEAILRAGHIPAGMELFSAGNESQLEVIKRWIEDSDIYMLLLGGRYGTLDPKTGISYTEIEYHYAQELGKPFFALVMSDSYLDEKVKVEGKDILELENPQKYKDFKNLVLSKISRFFNNHDVIKLAILESLLDIQSRHTLTGWVKANEIPDTTQILNQISELTERNSQLEQELRVIETGRIDKIGDYSFEELIDALKNIPIEIPAGLTGSGKRVKTNLLKLFIHFKKQLSIGVTNRGLADELEIFLIDNVISHLRIYDLAETVKVPSATWSKYQTSKLGNKFLAVYSLRDKDSPNNKTNKE